MGSRSWLESCREAGLLFPQAAAAHAGGSFTPLRETEPFAAALAAPRALPAPPPVLPSLDRGGEVPMWLYVDVTGAEQGTLHPRSESRGDAGEMWGDTGAEQGTAHPRSGRIRVLQPALERTRTPLFSTVFRRIHCTRGPSYSRAL